MKKIAITLALIGIIMIPGVANAKDNDVSFSFMIDSYKGNTNSDFRKRETVHYDNPWKVDMYSSNETSNGNSYTNYWLEKYNGSNVSATQKVQVHGGARYFDAYESACKVDVALTAENNNYNNSRYKVTGIWDEETW
ncbi:DUF2712 domain-containing protein [Clostridium chrysemydis]|uniref:DUF2712 domain-containing protein n=1 Tax=Clostridium chrysemydis TaxID=2665504 RepID=UPI0018835BAE|nr:DUF2712 domain-containing protein [Clostridium chrysemydis]